MDDFLLIPSPYLLPAAGRVYPIPLGGAVGMQVAVSEIVAPPDLETNPYWQNKVGQILLNSRRFISSEFIRKYFDKRFPHWQMPRTWSRENKEWVRLQSILWGEVWKMIEQLYGRSVLAPDIHPAVTFFKVVNECGVASAILPSRSL